jgi:hypothetical protein
MKILITLSFSAWALLVAPGCAIAQQLVMPAVPITVEAHVHDPEGSPVAHATVYLALPRYGYQENKGQKIEAQTNKEGVAIVSGTAQQDYAVSVEKSGYYRTQGPHRGINDEKSFQEYAVGVQKIDLELRPVRNPILGIRKGIDRRLLPKTDGSPLGFDLENGDWVAPHGKGKTSDFIFSVGGYFKSLNDFADSLTLTFSNQGDGIMPFRHPKNLGSALKWPYEAPLSGYESQRVWRQAYDGKRHTNNLDRSGEMNYLFRVRTELDEKGNVRRAMYGVISNEVVMGGNNEIGRNVSFTYALNPDWTRNLEFDPAKTASSPR